MNFLTSLDSLIFPPTLPIDPQKIMEKLSQINLLGKSRVSPPLSEREIARQQRLQQEKEQGYQLLLELCQLGEINYAKHLADQHSQWGYTIEGGEVLLRQ